MKNRTDSKFALIGGILFLGIGVILKNNKKAEEKRLEEKRLEELRRSEEIVKCKHCFKEYKRKELKDIKDIDFLDKNPFNSENLPFRDISFCVFRDIELENICEKCFSSYIYNEKIKIENALKNSHNIEIFPRTYKGKIDINDNNTQDICNEYYYEDKNTAKNKLKTKAAYLGYDLIFDLYENSKENYYGNYIYNTWSYKGTAAKIKKNL